MLSFRNMIIATSLAASFCASALAANYGWTFTYQGSLKQTGSAVDAVTPMAFKLFAQSIGGAQVGPTLNRNVTVDDGLFTVDLDFTNVGTIAGVFDGADRWLEITVNGTTLAPRQQLRATPHAAVASLFQVPLAMDTMSPSIMHLKSHASTPQVRALLVETFSTEIGAHAITGVHNEDDNEGVGVYGISYSGNGFGLVGSNQSPGGNNTGIYGNSISPQGTGISGVNFSATGPTKGIWGSVESPDGWAGYFTGRGYFESAVGIGTEEPVADLEIFSTTEATLRLSSPGTGDTSILELQGGPFSGPVGSNVLGAVRFLDSTGEIDAQIFSGTGFLQSPLNFATAGTTRMVITSNGNVGIGNSLPTFLLHLGTNSAAKPTSSAWTVDSDRRLKKNIRPIEDSLDRLLQLKGVTYQWIDPDSQGGMDGTYTGMIAQDVQQVFPEWVAAKPDGFLTLTPIGFEGLVVEALRDLRAEKDAEIDELQSQISDLQSANQSLQLQLDTLRDQLQQLAEVVVKGGAK
jgi:hypothetical protein